MKNLFNIWTKKNCRESSQQTGRTVGQVIENIINNMVMVEGDEYIMGLTDKRQTDPFLQENPLFHKVAVSSFKICKYTVTQDEWKCVIGNNPSEFVGPHCPVTNISWLDCQEFIKKINNNTDNKYGFRLPTEAEWEFAARGGKKSKGYRFAGSNKLDEVAWADFNGGNKTHDVGGKQPNELGLYDMTGNIWEWCQDWYDKYDLSYKKDPQGPDNGFERVFRGGAFDSFDGDCSIGQRSGNSPVTCTCGLGFRLVMR